MRNLRNIQRSITTLPGNFPLTAVAWDGQDLICAHGPLDGNIELFRLDSNCQISPLTSWVVDHPEDEILSLHFFADTASACLILKSGDIIIVKDEVVEVVGSIDAGITGAAWSPDEELIAITTAANTLLFMTRDFDGVADVTFSSDDVKASNNVSVGWGKKETQFEGKRAKALKDPTMPEKIDEGILTDSDTGKVSISWRGDGAYVAINSICSIDNKMRRMIRVFSREGALDSVSEPADYLECALSWRPAGNLIASIQRLPDDIRVVFFERNGLRHGQFSLRLTLEQIKSNDVQDINLQWNIDSTVLAVSFQNRVEFWTMNNCHYYLKREIPSLDISHGRNILTWHPESALKFSLTGSKSVIQNLEFVFDVAAGPMKLPNDAGLISVVDGKTIKITPLRMANVPPPMSLHEIILNRPPIDVQTNECGDKIIILTEEAILVYKYDPHVKPIAPPSFLEKIAISQGNVFPRGLWIQADHPLVVCDAFDSEPFVIDAAIGQTPFTRQYPEIFIDLELQTSTHPWLRKCSINGLDVTFGLTRGGKLFADKRLLASNCTSFVITSVHLIFTTAQHLLKFVHLDDVKALEVPADEPEKDERCRSIERGAKLVTAIPSTYAVVLQMPRGNLETIYPRAMVVAGIRRNIENKDYKNAFLACRNQRVDTNILHDHAPEQFLTNVDLFIKQVRKIEHIDLFLSTLKEEDVSQTMYKETLSNNAFDRGRKGIPNINESSKINRICDAFLGVLYQKISTNLQNIITANVCKSPPDLEAGLSVVAELRKEGDELAEKAAEHICFLADVNQLYNHALGMYDLDLALLIAQQSQKDPREYLPYLQSLQELETVKRQFTIDKDLGRHQKALKHLHKLDAFDEFQNYTKRHALYSLAVDLYRYNTDRLNSLMAIHAEYLSANNKFSEAGMAYEFLGQYQAALDAYRAANMWQEALSSAALVPLNDEEMQELASSLAGTLVEMRQYSEAAIIHVDYLNDVETASRLLCKGYHFAAAIRLVSLRGSQTLLNTTIDPGLVEGSATITELLADMKTQLGAQIPRLRELRQKKATDPLAFYAGTEEGGGDIPDNVSLAPTDASTSGGTFMTRYTHRTDGTIASNATRKTSKNRRREERKRARGKKGSVYEEEYLVSSIERLVERTNNVTEEVSRLIEGLTRRAMRERALAVQAAMRDVIEACIACLPEVFGTEQAGQQDVGNGDVGDGETSRPAGGDGVLWDSMEEGRRKRESPIVKAFRGLSLLG